MSYCGSDEDLTEFEGKYFSPEACFTGVTLPYNGHYSALRDDVREKAGLYPTAERVADLTIGPSGMGKLKKDKN